MAAQFYRKVRSFGKELVHYLSAGKYVAVYPEIKARKNHVNLFEYHPEKFYQDKIYNNSPWNLGDSLSFVIVDWMLRQKGLTIESDTVGHRKYFLNSVGSNLLSSYQNVTVWGSGCGAITDCTNRFQSFPFRKLDIRAVRGPLTRQQIMALGHKCPEVYGDPAILMPFIYQPDAIDYESRKEILLIPQFLYEKDIRSRYPQYPIESMNTNDYRKVIDSISSSKKVITSSLHAIILAEAYGVPAVFFKSLSKDFKFRDYYASTGRCNIKLADNIEEALEMEPLPIPDLSFLQKGLLESFPYDLWIEKK